ENLVFEAGSFYIMDRSYIDFERLNQLHQHQAFFVIRAKSNMQFKRIYSQEVDRSTGLRCDQTVALTGFYASKGYPEKLRRIKFYDDEHDVRLTFLTNNFMLPALSVAQLYKRRWQIGVSSQGHTVQSVKARPRLNDTFRVISSMDRNDRLFIGREFREKVTQARPEPA
ncbi:MAG TPA: transposase, partial [Bacteroidota bacterium]|nr:transposase [Bacteroidota bacterium]